jgi:membrane associated rhomboid family serine protease
MKLDHNRGTVGLVVLIGVGFVLEFITNSIGNDSALLKLGALPDDGQLNGQFWRIATYSFLHFDWFHLFVNVLLLLWIGRIVEKSVGTGQAALIYIVSVLCSAAVIVLVHSWHPKPGATVGASGGVFGLLGAALVIFYRQNTGIRLQRWLWTALVAGFAVSLLPGISMAGHIGGIIGGAPAALFVKVRKDEN